MIIYDIIVGLFKEENKFNLIKYNTINKLEPKDFKPFIVALITIIILYFIIKTI